MKLTTIITTGLAALLAMAGIHASGIEKLVGEDGKVAAKKLTLDRETAETAFETATFGMG